MLTSSLNTCTVCLSKMYKLLGVWAVAWLLPDKVCSVYIQVERLSQNPFTPGYFSQNIKLECKTPKVIKSSKAKPGSKKVKTCECSDNKRNIVLKVTRVRGLPIRQKRAPENIFFCVLLVLGFSHTRNCLLRTYSQRLTEKNLIGKVPLSHEVPLRLL